MNNLENLEADIAYNRGLTAMLDLLKEEKLISSYAHSQGRLKLDSTILSLVDKKLDLKFYSHNLLTIAQDHEDACGDR